MRFQLTNRVCLCMMFLQALKGGFSVGQTLQNHYFVDSPALVSGDGVVSWWGNLPAIYFGRHQRNKMTEVLLR